MLAESVRCEGRCYAAGTRTPHVWARGLVAQATVVILYR